MVVSPPPPSEERPGTHCTGRWVGPRAGLDGCRISRPGIRSRTAQPVASHYTVWAISTRICMSDYMKLNVQSKTLKIKNLCSCTSRCTVHVPHGIQYTYTDTKWGKKVGMDEVCAKPTGHHCIKFRRNCVNLSFLNWHWDENSMHFLLYGTFIIFYQ